MRVWRRVFTLAAAMVIAVATLASDIPTASAATFTVSGETTIYSNLQFALLNLDGWPDGEMGVEQSVSINTYHAATAGGQQRRTTGSLTQPALGSAGTPFSISGLPSQYVYGGGGPIYRDPSSGMLLLFTHLERPISANSPLYSVIGLSKSVDDGASWSFLGEIFTPVVAYEQCGGSVGFDAGSGTYVIHNDGGADYFYMYVHDRLSCSQVNSLAVVREPVADVVTAAGSDTVSTWSKYYDGGWAQSGLGGLSSERWTDALPWYSFGSASWNTYLDKYVMVIARPHAGLLKTTTWWLELVESSDGLTWSTAQVVASSFIGQEYVYPTILSNLTNGRVTGQEMHVYYVWSTYPGANRWQNADLKRRTINFT